MRSQERGIEIWRLERCLKTVIGMKFQQNRLTFVQIALRDTVSQYTTTLAANLSCPYTGRGKARVD